MKKKILLVLWILMICVPVCLAHPPTDVTISYSSEDGILTIQSVHQTSDREKHYIRKVEVIPPDGKPMEFYYARQENVVNDTKEIPIKLEPNETIQVKLYCSEGGVAQKSFTVPQAKE